MKEELTSEFLEAIIDCGTRECTSCPAKSVCESGVDVVHEALAGALLEEMDKPKVWDVAPEWATSAEVTWESVAEGKRRTGPTYTRELPKTRGGTGKK